MQYTDFLESKRQLGGRYGFTPTFLPSWLFDFQSAIVSWAIEKGRGGVFADCGLGKTPMSLAVYYRARGSSRYSRKPEAKT